MAGSFGTVFYLQTSESIAFWQCCDTRSVRSVFLGPPVSGSVSIFTDPNLDPNPSINKQKRKKKHYFYNIFSLRFDFLSSKTDVNVPSKSNKQKNLLFVGILSAIDEKAGSGSVSQGYGSADLDPYQNVKDQQHCLLDCSLVTVPVPSIAFTVNQ